MYYSSERIIKNKVGLLNLAQELGNISRACKVMGFSRETFYRYQHAVDEGGIEALLDKNRRVPNIKNRVDEVIETAVTNFALEFPAYGQIRASNELRKKGIFVSPSGARSIWLRHQLSCLKNRLSLLERKSAEDGFILTESQVAALEKKKDDDLACGETRQLIQDILVHKTHFMWVTLKEWDVSISKRLLIRIPKWLLLSFIQQKPLLPLLIY